MEETLEARAKIYNHGINKCEQSHLPWNAAEWEMQAGSVATAVWIRATVFAV